MKSAQRLTSEIKNLSYQIMIWIGKNDALSFVLVDQKTKLENELRNLYSTGENK